ASSAPGPSGASRPDECSRHAPRAARHAERDDYEADPDTFRPEPAPAACPADRSSAAVAWVVYGLPVPLEALQPDLDEERVSLGGCCVGEGAPEWRCRACGHGWGRAAILDELERMRKEAGSPTRACGGASGAGSGVSVEGITKDFLASGQGRPGAVGYC